MRFFNFGRSKTAEPEPERKDPTFDTKGLDDFGIDLTRMMPGGTISPATAAKLDVVYACIRDKAEAIGQLPVRLYRNDKPVKEGRDWKILTQKPNDYMTMQGLLELMTTCLEMNGVFYVLPILNDRGAISELVPLRYQRACTPQMDVNGKVYYRYTTNDGKPAMEFAGGQLVVINLMTFNGYTPVSPITQNALLLGLAKAQEETVKELNENGITSQIAIKTDKKINSDQQIERIRREWKEFRGPKGAKKTPILDDGLDVTSLKISPKDMSLIESRHMTATRICSIFGVPPEKIGVGEKNKGLDLGEIYESYMRDSLNPHLVRFENAINLLLSGLRGNYRIKIDRKAYYTGSPQRLIEAISKEFSMCGCSMAEMRSDLGREHIPGTEDIYAIDTNNLTLGSLDDIKKIQAQLYGSQKENSGESNNEA